MSNAERIRELLQEAAATTNEARIFSLLLQILPLMDTAELQSLLQKMEAAA